MTLVNSLFRRGKTAPYKSLLFITPKKILQYAKENGIASIGVTYGYGSREELEKDKANYICDTLPEVEEIILKKC